VRFPEVAPAVGVGGAWGWGGRGGKESPLLTPTQRLASFVQTIALALSATGGVALAQIVDPAGPGVVTNAPEASAPFESLLAEFQAPELARRERASRSLDALLEAMRLGGPRALDLAAQSSILAEAQRSDLPIEARLRLVGALRQRFFSSPRAAMGIQFNERALPTGVQILQTFDGFPARELKLLLPDDIIMAIDGVRVSTDIADPTSMIRMRSTVQSIIISHDPGDRVAILVLRPGLAPNINGQVKGEGVLAAEGQKLELLVPLGTITSLPGNGEQFSPILESAWRVRLARMGWTQTTERILASTITPSDWSRHQARPQPTPSLLTVSATAQPGALENSAQGAMQLAAWTNARVLPLQPGGQVVIEGRLVPENNNNGRIPNITQQDLRQMVEIQAAIEVNSQQLRSLSDQLARPDLAQGIRDSLTKRLENAKQAQETLQATLTQIINRLQKRRE